MRTGEEAVFRITAREEQGLNGVAVGALEDDLDSRISRTKGWRCGQVQKLYSNNIGWRKEIAR